jgi:hypothetical protein
LKGLVGKDARLVLVHHFIRGIVELFVPADLSVTNGDEAQDIDRIVGKDAHERGAGPGPQVDDLLCSVGGEPKGGPRSLAARLGKNRDAIAAVGSAAKPLLHVGRALGHELDSGAARDVGIEVVGHRGVGFMHETEARAVLKGGDVFMLLDPIAEKRDLLGHV